MKSVLPVKAVRAAVCVAGACLFLFVSPLDTKAQTPYVRLPENLRETGAVEPIASLNSAACDVRQAFAVLISEGELGSSIGEARARFSEAATLLTNLSDDPAFSAPLTLQARDEARLEALIGESVSIETQADYMTLMATLAGDASTIAGRLEDGTAEAGDLAHLMSILGSIGYLTAMAFDVTAA